MTTMNAAEPAAPASTSPDAAGRAANPVFVPLLGASMMGLFLLLVYALVRLWPAYPCPDSVAACRTIWMFGGTFSLAYDVRILLLVVVVGSLGSFIHQATSFADYVGNNRLVASWGWWYVLRVPIGGALSLVAYLSLRGGLMGNGDAFNVYGVAALAGLSGMFARQAADKLREVFETLFQSAANQERKNKLTSAEVPVITGLEPGQVTAGETPLLAITGTGLGNATAVRVGAADRKPREATATRATVALERSDTERPGELEVAVLSADGVASRPARLKVIAAVGAVASTGAGTGTGGRP